MTNGRDKQTKGKRPIGRRWTRHRAIFVGGAAVVIVLIVMATALLVAGKQDETSRGATSTSAVATVITSPYDLTELPGAVGLEKINEASFVSISLVSNDGRLTSYMLDSGLSALQALVSALQEARPVEDNMASDGSTLTFVFASRKTLTFALDLDHGLLGRADRVWRPAGDLKTLVEATIAEAGKQ